MTPQDYEDFNLQWQREFFAPPFIALSACCTGYDSRDIVLRVCLMSAEGEVLLSSLIQPPKTKPIQKEWLDQLSCSKDELKNAPDYQSVRNQLKTFCKGKNVIVLSRWIMTVFDQTADRTGGNKLKIIMHDLHSIEYNVTKQPCEHLGFQSLIPAPESDALAICGNIVERMQKLAAVVSTI